MSQELPRRPQQELDPIRFGDVFDVQGELASQPIASLDAITMQTAESQVLGETTRGGPASFMEAAARLNVRDGLLSDQDASDAVQNQAITVTEINTDGNRIVSQRIAGQLNKREVVQYVEPVVAKTSLVVLLDPEPITIGEALEASAVVAGDKPVDQSDAAAIKAAEVRATGTNEIMPGGIGAAAQYAANRNPRTRVYEEKTTISDVLGDATFKLPSDKVVSSDDANGVIEAEQGCRRNKPDIHKTPEGIAESMAAAARLNQNK